MFLYRLCEDYVIRNMYQWVPTGCERISLEFDLKNLFFATPWGKVPRILVKDQGCKHTRFLVLVRNHLPVSVE